MVWLTPLSAQHSLHPYPISTQAHPYPISTQRFDMLIVMGFMRDVKRHVSDKLLPGLLGPTGPIWAHFGANFHPLSTNVEKLKLLNFNVEGLDSILDNPEFFSLINKHDFCILTETMRNDDTKLNLENFWDFSLARPKCEERGRYSGGITILIKSHLKKGVKIRESMEGIVVLELHSTFLNCKT